MRELKSNPAVLQCFHSSAPSRRPLPVPPAAPPPKAFSLALSEYIAETDRQNLPPNIPSPRTSQSRSSLVAHHTPATAAPATSPSPVVHAGFPTTAGHPSHLTSQLN